MNEEPVSLDVCTNCVYILANGECIECTGRDTRSCAQCDSLAAHWGVAITLGTTLCDHCPNADGEECDPKFSTSPCQGCGDPLAGNRYHATGWIGGEEWSSN